MTLIRKSKHSLSIIVSPRDWNIKYICFSNYRKRVKSELDEYDKEEIESLEVKYLNVDFTPINIFECRSCLSPALRSYVYLNAVHIWIPGSTECRSCLSPYCKSVEKLVQKNMEIEEHRIPSVSADMGPDHRFWCSHSMDFDGETRTDQQRQI